MQAMIGKKAIVLRMVLLVQSSTTNAILTVKERVVKNGNMNMKGRTV